MLRQDNPAWVGGKLKRIGYILVRQPDHPNCTPHGYVQEHRLVMEKYLGRYLLKEEIIHQSLPRV